MANTTENPQPAVLLYADSETSADLLYFGRFFVPDAIIALGVNGKKIGVLNSLEYSRGVKESAFDTVVAYEELVEEAKVRFELKQPETVHLVATLLQDHDLKEVTIPQSFPAGLALPLQELGFHLKISPFASLFPARLYKTAVEADHIREGNRASALGIARAAEVLHQATIGQDNHLYFEGEILTSERLRQEVDIACLLAGAVAHRTIVAGGDQACDPHCIGSGPLRANELIIVDVFPRVTSTGYHGDMTRTFLKGKASPEQKKLVSTVFKAQQEALSSIKAGIDGKSVHAGCMKCFEDAGYKTEKRDGTWVGFFHGTGHGLGLEIHEAPRVSPRGDILNAGMVTTVEPGLYYPGTGGCRIEDVVLVTENGIDLLSSSPYEWEIA